MAHFYTPEDPYVAPEYFKGVIFDNDNTLYQEPKWAKELHEQAALYAVQQQIPDMTKPRLAELMNESRKHHGGSLELLEKEYNVNLSRLRTDHYKHLIDLTNKNGFFEQCGVPTKELEKLKVYKIPLIIATHGNLEWTLYTLGKNNLHQTFNAYSIVTKDDVGVGKVTGPEMFIAALDKAGATHTENLEERGKGYVMVEDSAENLKYAKALGMTTILIVPDLKPGDPISDYVDVVVKDSRDSINVVIASNNNHLANIHDAVIETSEDPELYGSEPV